MPNFEEQNKVMEPSIIIVDYCIIIIIIITAYYNFIVQSMHNRITIFLIKASSRNVLRKKIWK